MVRFVRITLQHVTESDKDTGDKLYILQGPDFRYLTWTLYVEMKLIEAYPMLLTEVYIELSNVGILPCGTWFFLTIADSHCWDLLNGGVSKTFEGSYFHACNGTCKLNLGCHLLKISSCPLRNLR